MPPAQWVLDAAYAAETAQSSFSTPASPQRHRRGGYLHLDLRGVPAGPGPGVGGPGSPSQAPAAQWKPASTYKPPGGTTSGGASDGPSQHYSAFLLSVLSAGGAGQPGAGTSPSQGFRPSGPGGAANSMTVLSSGGTRTGSSAQSPATDSMGQRPRQLAARTTTGGGYTISRMPGSPAAGAAASSSMSAGGATPGGAAAARPITYNPLLPRQGSASAGRRRPSTELWPSELSYPASPGGVQSPPWGTGTQRRTTANGAAAQSSANGGAAAAAAAVAEALNCRAAALSVTAQKQQQQRILFQAPPNVPSAVPQLYGCHPEDLVTPVTAAVAAAAAAGATMEGRSPRGRGTLASGGGGGGSLNCVESVLSYLSGTVLGHGPEPGSASFRSRSRFEPSAAAAAAAGDGSSSGGGGRAAGEPAESRQASGLQLDAVYGTSPLTMAPPQPATATTAPTTQQQHHQQHHYLAPSVSMQTALSVLGGGVAPLPPPSGAGRAGRAAAAPPAPPPRSSSSASSTGPPGRVHSPIPSGTAAAVNSSFSGTEDSEALEYFGLYEGDALTAEDDDGEGEEDDDRGEDEEEEGCGSGTPPRRATSSRGVRSTASVHAARRAAVGAAGAAASTAPVGAGPRAAAADQQPPRQLSPWTLQRPPSGAAGRPPAAPLPPAGPASRRRSSLDAAAGSTAAAAVAAVYGSASVSSREGSVSEAGSRPGTASSAWSGYDTLLPPELKLPPGRGRSADSLIAAAGAEGGSSSKGAGGGAAAAASAGPTARRRAASNSRDAATLDARRSVGGRVPGVGSLSRCSSATSHRAAASGSGAGGGTAAVQALALLASLALTSPSSPGGASASSGGAAAGRKRALPTARGGKTAGGSAPPHRPLHPAVLAVADAATAAPAAPSDSIPTDEKDRPFPYILPPAFPGTCPTIAFVGSAAEKAGRGLTPLLSPTLYVKYGGVANTPVRTAFREAGLRPTKKGKRWVVQWGGILDAAALAKLHSFQRVNHFPGTWELGHKGHLYRNVYNARRRARGPAADSFDVVPRFYIMPRDYEEFRADCERYPDRLYIQKPTNSSRGRGIRMVTRPDAISRDAKDVLVQHYIANPLLLNGFKFDMRVYAAATCLDPLRLYVFPDGLARLATEPYSADRADLSKRCVHLTNYSVNKKSDKFAKQQQQQQQPGSHEGAPGAGVGVGAGGAGSAGAPGSGPHPDYSRRPADPSFECQGHKWSLSGLRHHLESRGMGPGWAAVWRQVCDIVAAAVIAAEPRMNTEFKMKVPHRNNCFEVWGFDIMLTDSFRAWLIEANTCPSLAADSGLDMRVKCAMVSELMHLLGPVPYDVEVYERAAEAKRQARLTGLPVATTPAPPPPPARGGGTGGGAGGEDEAPPPPSPSLGTQQSFGQCAGAGAAVVQPKSLHELEAIDFTALSPGELPDVVLEAEAEMARRGSWQRVFPCGEDPARYLNLFETPRLNNALLCKYYAQTGGAAAGGGAELLRRPTSVSRGGARGVGGGTMMGVMGSTGGSTGGRPPSREWRPGGGGG